MPRVSVIVSTYNRAALLPRAIASVLAQTYDDFEVVVVDDGSTDGTAAVMEAMTDPRIRYVWQDNQGLAAGRNRGLSVVRGEYIALLDDDDIYLPHKLAVQVGALDADPGVGWISGGYRAVDESGKLLDEFRPWLAHPDLGVAAWLFACPTVVHAVLVRRAWLERIGGFDAARRRSDDWDCWLRLATAGCPMAWQPEVVCVYHFHPTNMVRDVATKSQENLAILKDFFARPEAPPALLPLQDRALAQMHLRNAAAAFHAGDPPSARRAVADALQLNPGLAAEQGQAVVDMLLGYAHSPLVVDPLAYARSVIDQLDDPLFAMAQRRRELLGQVTMGIFFRAAERQDWATVRWSFPRGIWFAPAWLANRGVYSIFARSLLSAVRPRPTVDVGECTQN